jgi:membrane protease YdiL (CAAX protease family)
MNKDFLDFLIKLIALTIILIVVSYFTFNYLPLPKPTALYYIFGFFFVVISVIHYFLLKAVSKNSKRFPAYYMGGITLKLFLSMIFILIYAVRNPEQAKPFLVTFFVIYFIYTTYETILILKHLDRNKQNS